MTITSRQSSLTRIGEMVKMFIYLDSKFNFFLTMKDEKLLMLGTAFRGAQSDNFANGQGKSLLYFYEVVCFLSVGMA